MNKLEDNFDVFDIIAGFTVGVIMIMGIQYGMYQTFAVSINWWITLICTIIFGEIMYIKEPNKPNKDQQTFWGKIGFAAERKVYNFTEGFLNIFIVGSALGLLIMIVKGLSTVQWSFWISFLKVTGIVAGVCVLLLGYLWINSLKYKDNKKGKGKKSK